MDFFISIFDNKLLFCSTIAVLLFIIISILLVLRSSKKEENENIVDIEKIDGQDSVFDEIIEEKEKTNRDQLDLDSMIAKMQQDIDAKASEVVEKFEQEQEEKSVISYQELVNSKKDDITTIDVDASIALDHLNMIEEEDATSTSLDRLNMIEDENTSTSLEHLNMIEEDMPNSIMPVSIDETNILDEALKLDPINSVEISNIETIDAEEELNIIPTMIEEEKKDDIKSKLNMKEEFVEALKTGNYEEINEKPKNKFKATEFISPIYGVQNIKMQYPTVQNMKEFKAPAKNYNKLELEQTLNMKKISEEAHQDEDFLNALKEFRKNLE